MDRTAISDIDGFDHSLDDVRPSVHFTPQVGWMNDPNGLVSVAGEHHLFFQHHPHSTEFGDMHWGHAVSRDFVSWEHLPTAIAPDEQGMIFSGSAVVDHDRSVGFGAGAIVAVFTCHETHGPDPADATESQAIAWSVDGGRTFVRFDGNPVIEVDAARPLSRDPKVFWYSSGSDGHWVMALAATDEIRIFTSADLRSWRLTDAVKAIDSAGRALETPDLFPLVADDGSQHWVLAAGVMRGSPAGGSGTAMVLGDFDGRRFVPSGGGRWVDHGANFYAAQSWNGVADERRIWIAWMGAWGDLTPPHAGGSWRGQMSVPRELTLRTVGDDYLLEQRPVRELAATAQPAGPNGGDLGHTWRARALIASLPLASSESAAITVSRHGAHGVVRVDRASSALTVEIPNAVAGFGPPDGFVRRVPLPPVDVDLLVVLDIGSIEVFAGPVAVTDALTVADCEWVVAVENDGHRAVEQVRVSQLGSESWPKSRPDAPEPVQPVAPTSGAG